MKSARMTLWVMVALSLVSSKACGSIVYDFGGEHDIDFVVADSLVIADHSSGAATIVNLLDAGRPRHHTEVHGSSVFNIVGGRTSDTVMAYSNSHVSLSSGSIAYDLAGYHSSSLAVSGGGIFRNLVVYDNNQTFITGGSIGGILDAYDESVITIEGTGFNYAFGTIRNSTGILTGTLVNGDPINNRFYVHNSASIVITPEPCTLLLFGLGVMLLRRKKIGRSILTIW